MKHIHTFENFLTENADKKITVSLTSSAVESFKKDLDANKIPYTVVRPTVFELDDTPKARTAIKEAKGRFGMQSVLVKENALSEGRVKATDKIIIPMLSDIDLTRITKWCSANGIKDYKWEDSGDGYIMDTSEMPIRDQQDLDKYLFASRIEYTREFTK
jgi:predicted DNA binding CopG/RHH family protein